MSAAAGLLSQIVGGLGGAPAAAAIVVGGIVVGALGGGAVAGGAFSGGGAATSSGELAVYPCPDVGPALFTVRGGQRFLVTGRTEDGTWVRIHNPLPGRTEAWVQANPLTMKNPLADVPVAECGAEIEAAAASALPMPSLTAIQMNSPSPSPTPVPPADNPRPSLKGLTASTGKISYDTGGYCPSAVKEVTFKVKASDDSGVAGVTLFWRKPGSDTYAQSPMRRSAGSAQSGTWRVTLDTTANGITKAGNLAFYAVATDTGGATRRLPNKGADNIAVAVCVNTGPTIRASSTAGSDLSWKPLRTGVCQYPTGTNIRARVDDVDGVASATLFFRPPGEGWRSKPMTLSSGRWTASLDTGSDKIIISDPPTGNLRWYVKAVDKEGLESQTKTASITIHRCDTEAQFGSSSASPGFCPGRVTNFYGSASDPDGINGSSATLVYTYVAKDGSRVTRSVRMSGNQDGPWYYQAAVIGPSDLATIATVALYTTFEIRTTDVYGGRSRGGAGQVLQSCR